MAASNIPKLPKRGSVTIAGDGTVAAHTLDYEDGDVALSGSNTPERIVVRDRGAIVAVLEGDDPVLTITMTVTMREFTNAGEATPIDVVEFSGAWATQGSTTAIRGDHKFVTVTVNAGGSLIGDTADATIAFAGCVGTWAWAEGKPGKITLTFEVFGGYTRTGQA